MAIDLSPLVEPSAVLGAVAATLGLHDHREQNVVGRLAEAPTIVLLDNCEHLVDGVAALVDRLLSSVPGLTVVTTSREPLGLVGEAVWRVGPLATDAAAQLFVDRAAAVRPGFRLADDNAEPIKESCQRLDGIPLAIELAAARVALMSPHQIAAGLADRFRLLTSGGRVALSRQRTLEASVDWSYELLSEPERTALRRLSVFVGGFSLDAVEAVCGIDDALDVIARLVHRSMVVYDDSSATPRYRMLDTIRHYAQQRLIDAGELDATLDRHVEHFRTAARHQFDQWTNGAPIAFSWFIAEFDNLRAAVERARQAEDGAALLDLSMPMIWILTWIGPYDEWRDRVVALVATVPEAVADRRGSAIAMLMLAHVVLGEWDEAADAWDRYADAVEAMDECSAKAFALAVAGIVVFATRSTEDGRALGDRARALVGDEISQLASSTYAMIGFAEHAFGNLDRTADACDRALAIGRHQGADPIATFVPGQMRAWAMWARGDIDDAERAAHHELSRIDTAPARTGGGVLLATIALARGDLEGSERWIAFAAQSEVHHQGRLITAAYHRARQHLWLGDPASVVGAALPPTGAGGPRSLYVPMTVVDLVEAWLTAGDATGARHVVDEVERFAGGAGHRRVMACVRLGGARLARAAGDAVAATELARGAVGALAEVHAWVDVIEALDALGGALVAGGDEDKGARLLGAAAGARERFGIVEPPPHVRPVLHADALDVRGTEAWSAGAAMSIAEAAAYAQRGRGRRRAASIGWDALTATEIDVARLVATGLSNPDIGERLFISRRTVQAHLTHIYGKLGVSSRSELAALMATKGPA